MSRRCQITGKGPMSGNNVSHAENRTRRRFMPNIQETRLYSEVLERWVAVKASTSGLRTVEHRGGFDAFLVSVPADSLDTRLRKVRTLVKKALASRKAA